MSHNKNEELRKYLFENLDKEFKRASQSPIESSVYLYKNLEEAYNFVSTITTSMPLLFRINIFYLLLQKYYIN